MAKIKVIDFLKNVELNRRKLVDATGSSKLDSLDNVTNTAVEKLGQVEKEKHEVRFFDADGTQIGDSIWVEDGGSVTPPANPNIDPERLVFDEWYSVIGRFDNIIHDVDYGAHYLIKDDCGYIFLTLTQRSGLNVKSLSLSLKNISKTSGHILTIDWGDGTQDSLSSAEASYSTITKKFSHTYEKYGDYIIKLTPNFTMTIEPSISYEHYYPGAYWQMNSESTGTYVQTALDYNTMSELRKEEEVIDSAITKMYLPFWTPAYPVFDYDDSNINYVVAHIKHYNGSFKDVENVVAPKYQYIFASGNGSFGLSRAKMCIFNKDNDFRRNYIQTIYINGMDKLILPKVEGTPGEYYFQLSGSNLINKCITYENIKQESQLKLYKLLFYGENTNRVNLYANSTIQQLKLNDNILNIGLLGQPVFEQLKIPQGAIVSSNTFQYCYSIKYLDLYKDFNQSINLQTLANLEKTSLVNILNNLADISDTKTISIHIKTGVKYLKVKLNNGLYELSEDSDAITIIEALQQKGWTVSIYYL